MYVKMLIKYLKIFKKSVVNMIVHAHVDLQCFSNNQSLQCKSEEFQVLENQFESKIFEKLHT